MLNFKQIFCQHEFHDSMCYPINYYIDGDFIGTKFLHKLKCKKCGKIKFKKNKDNTDDDGVRL